MTSAIGLLLSGLLSAATTQEATLPGPLVSYALARGPSGRLAIVLLAEGVARPEPEAGSDCALAEPAGPARRVLMQFDPEAPGLLRLLRDGLPPDVGSVEALDLDADGSDELLLRSETGGYRLDRDGAIATVPAPGLPADLPGSSLDPARVAFPGLAAAGMLALHDLGILHVVRAGPGGELQEVARATLPIQARRAGAELKLSGERARFVGAAQSGSILLAAGPEPAGGQRLLTQLIEPAAAGNDVSRAVWSRLPSPERVLESAYGLMDGRPVLVVTTIPAGKLSFFGEKLVRLYRLDEHDRSRAGSEPLLAVETHVNLWQRVVPVLTDADRDGRQDLVLGYWKGLKDSRVVLDAYLSREDGSFSRSPVSTQFDVRDGSRSILGYGRDLDGDGLADLILGTGAGLAIFAGWAGSVEGRDLVQRTPSCVIPAARIEAGDEDDWSVSFGFGPSGENDLRIGAPPDPLGRARLVDLDADGRPEILIRNPDEKGRGRIQVIRFP